MLKQNKIILIALTFSGIAFNSNADTCTPPPSGIDSVLRADASYDKKLQLYRYKYTMSNGHDAQIPLAFFGIEISQTPTSYLSAPHWKGGFSPTTHRPFSFIWSTIEVANPDVVDNKTDIPAPLYPIKPHSSLSGFEITSPNPPGVTAFFATGYTQMPSATPTKENDEPEPNCPGWDFNSLNRVYGMTTGPSDPGILDVRIRAREESGLHRCAPIDTKNPKGKISVLVFSTRTFDASKISVSSVIFGPGFASPISSKLVPGGLGEQIDGDERGEWEKIREGLDPEFADRKNSHPSNLLLTFDVASLDVQCKLDQALFLRGKTISAQQFVGAVSSNLTGCDPHEIGKHKKHLFPYKWWEHKASH